MAECEYCDDRECEDLPIGRLMTINPDEDPYLTIRPLSTGTCVKIKNLYDSLLRKGTNRTGTNDTDRT